MSEYYTKNTNPVKLWSSSPFPVFYGQISNCEVEPKPGDAATIDGLLHRYTEDGEWIPAVRPISDWNPY